MSVPGGSRPRRRFASGGPRSTPAGTVPSSAPQRSTTPHRAPIELVPLPQSSPRNSRNRDSGVGSQQLRELELDAHRASLRDYRELVRTSVDQMILVELLQPIPVHSRPALVAEQLLTQPSRCVEASDSFARANGFISANEIIGSPLSLFFPPSSANALLFERWAESGFTLPAHELIQRSRGNGERVLQLSLYGVIERESLGRLWIVQRDITELRSAISAVQRQEEHYRALVERPGFYLVRARPDGRYAYVSPYVVDEFGYSLEEFYRKPRLFRSLVHPEDLPRVDTIFAARDLRSSEVVEAEFRVRVRDGTYRWFFERQIPKLDRGGIVEFYDSIGFDIQQRKSLELEFVSAQRMEIVGALAGGITHDLNNSLTALLGQLDSVRDALPSEHPAVESVSSAQQSALECVETARGLLAFSRKPNAIRNRITVAPLIERTATLLRHVVPSAVQVSVAIEAGLPEIFAQGAQIQQALMNLGINARDAMPSGGVITLRASLYRVAPGSCSTTYRQAVPGSYVQFSVQDTGTGIPAHVLPHLFQPFFTTKAPGSGTGLGLSSVRSVVDSHGGDLSVTTVDGEGSQFAFIIRGCAPAEGAARSLNNSPPAPAPGKSGSAILLVEDEPAVRGVTATALEMRGYAVISAETGEEALRLLSEPQRRRRVGLVLADQTMPGITGVELLAKIHQLDPELQLILMSGMPADPSGRGFNSLPFCSFLAKPFLASELVDRVASQLGMPELSLEPDKQAAE